MTAIQNNQFKSLFASGLLSFKEPPKPIHQFKSKIKVTDEQVQEILNFRKSGEPYYTIGRRFGMHHYTVEEICKKHGLVTQSRTRTKAEVEKTKAEVAKIVAQRKKQKKAAK